MKTGEIIHGFTVEENEFIKESDAELFTMSHASGARLAFLARKDENKTFSIGFLTPPEDDTGVFHIIEHSTLCGSESFPVKEPFVELLKGSLNTFLNAMTYEDRTVYPVSSRCDRDFYNLVNVYLDAVFFPLMKSNPFIFEQEGWRYEYDETAGRLSYNGVVYNEMKGAYSSADELGYAEISRLLYGGCSYGKNSGGSPEHIPELSYEEFCRLHDKYYKPQNAYIYLDGSVELDTILPLIDSYLKRFPKSTEQIALCVKTEKGKKFSEISYEASSEESGSKARLLLAYPFSDFSKTDEKILSSVITAYLCGSNEAPLTGALLDSGLCEDVNLSVGYSGCYTLVAEIKGFDPKDKQRLLDIYSSVIEKECRAMDKSSLHASLNRTEFKLRERDLGSFPIGVSNALSVYELWSYGGKPASGLVFEDDIKKVRQGIDSGEAEALLRRMIKDNECAAEVLMLPSTAAAKEKAQRLDKLLADKLSSMTESELSALRENQERFTAWQHSEDSKEAISSLPALSLSDISAEESRIKTERGTHEGAQIIRHRINTRGITYLTMFFDGSDLKEKELSKLSLLASVLTNIETENYSVKDLKNEIRSSLGSFVASSSVIANSKKGFVRPALKINASALETKSEFLVSLTGEILGKTLFKGSSAVKKLLVQSITELEDVFTSNGESVAMGRVEAMSGVHGRIGELLHGYEYFLNLKEFLSELEADPDRFMQELEALSQRLFVKERLTLALTAENEELIPALISVVKSGNAPSSTERVEKLPRCREGIVIPSEVGYASAGAILPEARGLLGTLRVVRSVLSYEYLWNNVRVKGGAYGAGFVTRRDSGMYFYSYRDPSPERSLQIFKKSGDYLRALAKSGADLTKFIIGAYGEYDMLKTPKTAFAQATADALTDWTDEDERLLREGLLGTTCGDLKLAASLLDKLAENFSAAVAAGSEMLASFDPKLDKLLKV